MKALKCKNDKYIQDFQNNLRFCAILINYKNLQPQPGTLIDVVGGQLPDISIGLLGAEDSTEPLPEMDVFEVELKKDAHGLGITIAGYVCEKGSQSQPNHKQYFYF